MDKSKNCPVLWPVLWEYQITPNLPFCSVGVCYSGIWILRNRLSTFLFICPTLKQEPHVTSCSKTRTQMRQLLLFVCYASLRNSTFSIIYINLKKEKESMHIIYTLLIQYLCKDQILSSNSCNSSQKCPLKFFFLPLFLNLSNII